MGLKVVQTGKLTKEQLATLWPEMKEDAVGKFKLLPLAPLTLTQLQWLYKESLLTRADFEWELEARHYDSLQILALGRQALGQEVSEYLAKRVG